MTILGGESKSYELRLWIDGGVQSDNKEVMNKIFESKVTIEGEYDPTYTEVILNGTDPVLAEGLIPVTISDSGVVKKADTSTEWYSYGNKKWANAVILEDESIVYQNGDTIPESNIESYFVWIPRYRYQIFDNGLYEGLSSNSYEEKSQEIKVVFENRETQLSKGTKKGDWLTHPAFTSFDSNGMWVGKFETGYKGATTIEAAQSNTYDVTKIEIKPNVYSWRGIQVSNAHLNSYNYKRDMDSHMMKNTEWGAVAYLQHSKYGSMSSVRINNNTAFITGYSAVSEPTCGYTGVNEDCNKYESIAPHADGTYTLNYFNSGSTVSSTTGNYSGIYDMSGGAHEYVMAVVADKFGIPMSGRNDLYNGGFNGIHGCPTCNTARGNDSSITSLTSGIDFPDAKYYDLYAYGINQEDYPRGILGDATSEMGPFFAKIYGTQNRKISSWYSNVGWLNSTEDPWLRRGYYADYGTDSGIFQFNGSSGEAGSGVTYRIVLTPGGNL